MKYILKHKGSKQPDVEKVADAIQSHDGEIVDGSMMPKFALVTMEPSRLESLQAKLKDWDIFPEKSYEVPTTRKTIGKNRFGLK